MEKKQHTLLLGAHMSTAGGLEKALERGESIHCTAIQLFTKSNRQWSAKHIPDTEAELFKQRAQKSSITHLIAHASYLINLCSPDNATQKKSVHATIDELQRCTQLGIRYLVLHPGSFVSKSEKWAIPHIAQSINEIFTHYAGNAMLLLETMAGQGSTVCRHFEQLEEIRTQTTYKKKIGYCLDTCHIFAAGYDIRTKETYEKTMYEFDTVCSIKNLKAIHLNDSKRELGSRIDRHEEIGQGQLGLDTFGFLMNDARLLHIPKILETPNDTLEAYAHNMAVLKNTLSK